MLVFVLLCFEFLVGRDMLWCIALRDVIDYEATRAIQSVRNGTGYIDAEVRGNVRVLPECNFDILNHGFNCSAVS